MDFLEVIKDVVPEDYYIKLKKILTSHKFFQIILSDLKNLKNEYKNVLNYQIINQKRENFEREYNNNMDNRNEEEIANDLTINDEENKYSPEEKQLTIQQFLVNFF